VIPPPFLNPLSHQVWAEKYRGPDDTSLEATWARVAAAVASVEGRQAPYWRKRYLDLLADFRFLPGGRILAGAGVSRRVTLFNCFVGRRLKDGLAPIFDALKEAALTMQQGGGVGFDFSPLRPAGTPERSNGALASGPVAFLKLWDAMCATLLTTGNRRGAMMGTLRCDHPDIEAFIEAKSTPGALPCFNLSVQITDAFMEAVAGDAEWSLCFPLEALPGHVGPVFHCAWGSARRPVACGETGRVRARVLWERMLRAAYDHGEPGVLFVDTIDRWNNLAYRERITTTNPCGEVPLPPHGACDLGSLNLTAFMITPFEPAARLDHAALEEAARIAVRFLDAVIDLSRFPLPAQRRQARGSRRIGLGVTGLADALILRGLRYDRPEGVERAASWMRALRDAAYAASVELAREKGPFPWLERTAHLERPFVQNLPERLRRAIARHGIRNSHLLAVAPTGTISLLANNLSSGIEPLFALRQKRRVRRADGGWETFELDAWSFHQWRVRHPRRPPPETFITVDHLTPEDHLRMQAALQPYVDNAISKTVNVPADYPFEAFRTLYERAWRLGLKGCTTFRPNPITGTVLEPVVEHGCCPPQNRPKSGDGL